MYRGRVWLPAGLLMIAFVSQQSLPTVITYLYLFPHLLCATCALAVAVLFDVQLSMYVSDFRPGILLYVCLHAG